MQQESKIVPLFVTPQYLSSFDKSQLIDLLQQKTRHLLAASVSHIADQEYLKSIKQEVETIQAAIISRKGE